MPTDELHVAPNLAINEEVQLRRASGESILHLGLGESRLPVLSNLIDRLRAGAHRSDYGPVAGTSDLLAAIAGYFTRRRLPTNPHQLVVAPGSKPLLAALVAAIGGDLLLPAPCWVTYPAQVRLFARGCYKVPTPRDYGGIPEPDALRQTITTARNAGGNPQVVVLTLPDNPTGTLAPPGLIAEVCEVAESENLVIVSDEIYRDIVFSPVLTPVLSPAEIAPDRTVITTGLSKSLSLGGWRIGAARFPEGKRGVDLRRSVLAIASQTWSTLAGPMQEVAQYAFSEPPEVLAYIRRCANLHRAVALRVREIMVAAGATCPQPVGAFYVYPDFENSRDDLAAQDVTDSLSLERHLLRKHHVAVLGGHHFGDDPQRLRFRAATSLLYGETEAARRLALYAADPVSIVHVAAELNTLAAAIGALTSASALSV